ncbi:hypothetical protein EYF80_018979 [Liparis tanakae]|uniref:Uncharacterized protein n=1 Tax=Liparis tanakae TaxID=230148 RepID=A0A4Z2HZS8_9TELE|nr:hypothetical protein EYF80_018979 [Liparis tanakae]
MAVLQAAEGSAPALISSTANADGRPFAARIVEAEEAPRGGYLGRKRIMTSPSPVAAAPPAELSTKAPAPTMGESPTRLKGGGA